MRIITVSRQFGSGGRELGKRLADHLGFAYYDREIITAVAEQAKINEDYAERMLESGSLAAVPLTFGKTFAMLPAAGDTAVLLSMQHRIIRSLAERGDCIIVGRSANVILSDLQPFRIFVYADMEARIARCRSRAEGGERDMTNKGYTRMINRVDRDRASRHDLISEFRWNDPLGYDLCVNTTGTEIKAVIPSVAGLAESFFAQRLQEYLAKNRE